MRTVLIARLDGVGGMVLAGPAIRAVAAGASRVILLASPRGREAARLLPGVDDVLAWPCPWADPEPGPVRRCDVLAISKAVSRLDVQRAVIFTAPRQDPLPTALMLRMAEVPHITAASEDYSGALLDVRHRLPDSRLHEVERMLAVAAAAGFPPPADQRLRLRSPLPETPRMAGALTFLPGASAPAAGQRGYVVVGPRGPPAPGAAPVPEHCAQYAMALASKGWRVAVTGSADERALTAQVAGECAVDLGGRTTLADLARVLAGAAAVIAGNTGPAQLAAAVGTPVVSLFAPNTVPLEQRRPWGVPHVVLGAPGARCAAVTPEHVVAAVRQLAGSPAADDWASLVSQMRA